MITRAIIFLAIMPLKILGILIVPKNIREKIVAVTIRRHIDNNGGHPHIIIDKIGNNYVSVGLTKSNKKSKKLTYDPLGKGKPSRLRREGTVDKISNYGSAKEGSMTESDYNLAVYYADKAKIKHKKK